MVKSFSGNYLNVFEEYFLIFFVLGFNCNFLNFKVKPLEND